MGVYDRLRYRIERLWPFSTADAGRAMRFWRIADDNPHEIPLSECRELLRSYDPDAQQMAAEAIAEIADDRPDDIRETIDDLYANLYHDDGQVQISTALALREISAETPGEMWVIVDDMRDLLTKETTPALLRAHSIRILGNIAAEYPDEVIPAVDDLRANLTHDDEVVRFRAVQAFGSLGRARPTSVEPVIEDLISRLTDPESIVRACAAWVLAELGAADPDAIWLELAKRGADDPSAGKVGFFGPPTERLRALLDHEDPAVRAMAARGFAELAVKNPDEVGPAIDTLREHTDADHAPIRIHAIRALGPAAVESPAEIRSTVERLTELLSAEQWDDETRIRVVRALRQVAEEYPSGVGPAVGELGTLLFAGEPVAEEAFEALETVTDGIGSDRVVELVAEQTSYATEEIREEIRRQSDDVS